MQKQKRGFWLFIFSLIPGAGEMYMGFKKQGISIMLLFWGAIALASITGLGWLAMFLPVIWFYSFFNVHNLKSLSEEEFYSVDDNYILHMDQFSGDIGKFLALVVLVLQLAASGGTFPVETIDKGFQGITSYLPMTYSIKLFREILVPTATNFKGQYLSILVGITVVTLAITCIVDVIKNKKSAEEAKV